MEAVITGTDRRRGRHGVRASLVGALATLALPLSASANTALRFDGAWNVHTSAETGSCNKNYDFKLNVKGGKVTYAGYLPVQATGGINTVGVVKMTLSSAAGKVVATGLAEGDRASGDWASAEPNCSGSWFARRS